MLDRLEPPPRVTDAALLMAVVASVATGVASLLFAPATDGTYVFLHAVGGLALVVLLGFKLRRVAPRLRRVDYERSVSVALVVVTVATLATGVLWVHTGLVWLEFWTLAMVHYVLGIGTLVVLVWHLRHRFRWPGRADVAGRERRTALQFGALLVGGAVVWRAQSAANRLLSLPGRSRRRTGSKEAGSDDGNAFPVTSWVADAPDPVDEGAWTLTVTGAVERERRYGYGDLPAPGESADVARAPPTAARRALLDCTSGWYSDHEWHGVDVTSLLDAVGTHDDAAWVRFVSVTGYRWSLPLSEVRERRPLLATHVDGETLSHGHGFPLRLVAPERRGFQWVKWIERVEVRRRPDPAQWVAIHVSGFD